MVENLGIDEFRKNSHHVQKLQAIERRKFRFRGSSDQFWHSVKLGALARFVTQQFLLDKVTILVRTENKMPRKNFPKDLKYEKLFASSSASRHLRQRNPGEQTEQNPQPTLGSFPPHRLKYVRNIFKKLVIVKNLYFQDAMLQSWNSSNKC